MKNTIKSKLVKIRIEMGSEKIKIMSWKRKEEMDHLGNYR